MKAMMCGGAVLALLAGDAFAQGTDNTSGAKPKAAAQSKSAPAKPAAAKPAATGKPTTSKITFHSRPPGARITLDNGKSCVAPCSMIVGFNEKFTAIASKPGYQKKEVLVSPSLTDTGKAQVIGSAIGAGLIGMVVGAAIADRAYGPEPFVVELTPEAGRVVATAPTLGPSKAAAKPAAAPKPAQAKAAAAPKAASAEPKAAAPSEAK